MPKLSLSRRHRRQANLLQWNGLDPDSTREGMSCCSTTPRKVSEEDLNGSSLSSSHDSCGVMSLKRHATASCLVDLMENTHLDAETMRETDVLALSCGSHEVPVNVLGFTDPLSPTSPWGHFVDLVDQDDTSGVNNGQGPSTTSKMFVASCVSPVRTEESSGPYPAMFGKRRRLLGNSSTEVAGFFLSVPAASGTNARFRYVRQAG